MEAVDALKVAEKLLGRLVNRRPFVLKTDEYYEGKQPLAFASREWSEFHKDRYAGFSDNWCAPVADASSERIHLLGVKSAAGLGVLWKTWQASDGEEQFSMGSLATAVNSCSYALVWGEDAAVTWEHASEVWVEKDPGTRRTRYAIKSFVDEDEEFLTLFTPTEVWKWKRKTALPYRDAQGVVQQVSGGIGGGWQAHIVQGDVSWPLRNPLGRVPVVEFPNRPRLARGPVSDIAGAMAMQDAINLLWSFMFGAADHASLPARIVTGQEPPKQPILDENGQHVGDKPIDIKDLQHGRLLWLSNENAKVDQWDSAKLDVFTDVIEIAVGHIAAQTRTPPHYLNTKAGISNLSGDALVAAETGLVKKVEEQIRAFRRGLRELFQLMALSLGEKSLVSAVTADVFEFANPAMRSEAQLTDALVKKSQIGYPFEYLMELDGVSPEDRERVLAMRERDLLGDYQADGVVNVPADTTSGD
ncbi:phage portal protein [Timonella senegalensis]|uniref:phage portal protein n=1 Tax=Timonella senegalensis TaxID=1465825 RepID=UPI002FDCBD84